MYLHARYYDPKLGIFLSPDPIGPAGGTNLYGYGLGDPVNSADRSGLAASTCVDAGGWNPDATCFKTSEFGGSGEQFFNFVSDPGQVLGYWGSGLAPGIGQVHAEWSNLSQTSTTTMTYADGTVVTITRTADGAVTTSTTIAGQTTTETSGGCANGRRGVTCSTQVSVNSAGASPYGSVRVYSSPAFGLLGRPLGLNHAFVYSDGAGRGKGTDGSSWVNSGDGVGDMTNSPYVRVSLPPGMSQEEFMQRIENADGWNNWVWCGFLNDCHSDLQNAFRQAGVPYPGAPNGRMDIDDHFWAAAQRAMNRIYFWRGW
jgi:hypothetical protein